MEKTKSIQFVLALLAAVTFSACEKSADAPEATPPTEATEAQPGAAEATAPADAFEIAPGLSARILKNGYGRTAQAGDLAEVHYTGWLFKESDGFIGTAPVGSFPAGAGRWGHVDLAGNVEEWTSSAACSYSKYDCDEPRRVIRGGAYDTYTHRDVRHWGRGGLLPDYRGPTVGFRCAL